MLSAAQRENIERGVKKYQAIMKRYWEINVSAGKDFQRLYNGFYRIRRGKDWRLHYYQILEGIKTKNRSFEDILRELQKLTGRIEASFSSKMYHTRNPTYPIIDSRVLNYMSLRLPNSQLSVEDRLKKTTQLYDNLIKIYGDILSGSKGRQHIEWFDKICPDTEITNIKKIDFILWQIGLWKQERYYKRASAKNLMAR